MKQALVLIVLAVCCFLSTSAGAEKFDLPIARPFHDSLGIMIDSQENHRFHLFQDFGGFTAAKVYSIDDNDYQLHLLRNSRIGAQMIIQNLTAESFTLLCNQISIRMHDVNAGKISDVPVLTAADRQWADSSVTKKVTLRDGSRLFVLLQRAISDTLVVQTWGGISIKIPDQQIAEVISLREQALAGGFYRTDPNTSRLFFAPTGKRLDAKKGYFADYYVFLPTLAYGVTDVISLSGGFSILPGADEQIVYFAPKLTWEISPNLGLAAGVLYLGVPEQKDLQLAYSVVTYGGDSKSMTLGAGVPFGGGTPPGFILMIGGESQVSNSVKLISENWILSGDDTNVVFSGGVRFFGERLAVDLALLTVDEMLHENGFPFIPWVDFSVFFGKQ
ncbi:MAG: hypothetical protein EHM72_03290 [Calditrichaeota bacterium]|nr:MAG: hypothetical protein EHM72_20310 [Calditrichota bacterium]RPI02784.1 MAG: hypothetical protein EHM72_03290 [Calditrichota bacterium]